ncbi:MAG: hypothetical protein J6V66_05355 [Clostridia bacterium]|nr:hypothetical protein [Clostridia bacterium]
MYTYVINRGSSYHINLIDGGYEIVSCNNKTLKSQTVKDVAESSVKVGICEERVKLFDGKFLNRVRTTLTISKE